MALRYKLDALAGLIRRQDIQKRGVLIDNLPDAVPQWPGQFPGNSLSDGFSICKDVHSFPSL